MFLVAVHEAFSLLRPSEVFPAKGMCGQEAEAGRPARPVSAVVYFDLFITPMNPGAETHEHLEVEQTDE